MVVYLIKPLDLSEGLADTIGVGSEANHQSGDTKWRTQTLTLKASRLKLLKLLRAALSRHGLNLGPAQAFRSFPPRPRRAVRAVNAGPFGKAKRKQTNVGPAPPTGSLYQASQKQKPP